MSYQRDLPPKTVALGCLGLLGAGVVLLFVFYWIAPVIAHPFIYALCAHWPSWVSLAVLVFGVGLIGVERPGIGIPISAIGFIACATLFVMGSAWQHVSYLENTSITQLDAEPESAGFRFLPYEVASTVGSNKASDSSVDLNDFEPYVDGEEPGWISAREYRTFANQITYDQPGVFSISSHSDATTDDTSIPHGFGVCCFEDFRWESVRQHFWADYSPRAYPTLLNGQPVVVQPYLTRYFDFPVMVPQWAGSQIYWPDGTIEDLSAEGIANKYPGSRLFPQEMAEYFADAYQYKNGIWNAWFTHVDMPEVPKIEGMKNQMPYLIPTESGSTWYMAVEPYGKSNKSVYMAYYVDATTGDVSIYKFGENLIGPERALTYPPAKYQELKNLVMLEPRPVVRDGDLYWLMSATTSDYPNVQFTAVLNAKTEEVFRLDSQEAVEAFVAGDDSKASGETTQSSDEAPNEELVQLLRQAADVLEKGG